MSMLEEVYNWIDSRTGVSYDFNQELTSMSKGLLINNPNEFRFSYIELINELNECMTAIKTYREEIPEDFPGYKKLQEMFAATVLDGLDRILHSYMDELNLKYVQISTIDELTATVESMCELINLFRINSVDDIIDKKLFEKLDNEFDNIFTDRYELITDDIMNLSVIIESLQEAYDDTDDE